MKHKGFADVGFVCLLIVCALWFCLVTCAGAEELTQPATVSDIVTEEPTEDESQTVTEPPLDMQIFLLPQINREYSNVDKNEHFIDVLTGLTSLMPIEKSQTVLYASSRGDEMQLGGTPSFEAPYAVADMNEQLQSLPLEYGGQARRNIVIAIESRSMETADEIEQEWGELKALSASGVDVYVIGLETKKNKTSGKLMAEWIGAASNDAVAYENQMVQANEHLHFVWITDYNQCIDALQPLAETLTGMNFKQVQPDEQGEFVVYPYAEMIQEHVLLVEGNLKKVSILNAADEPIACNVVVSNDALTILQVTDEVEQVDTLRLSVDGKVKAVQLASTYKPVEAVELAFENRSGKSEFKRNEVGSFYATLTGVDPTRLVQSMAKRGVACEVIELGSGNVLGTMQYDAEDTMFQYEHTLTMPSGELQLCARISLDEGLVLMSEPYTVRVTNTAPRVTSQNETMYWTQDPWDATSSSAILIPLTVEDDEQDAVQLRLVEPASGVIPGLGSVSLDTEMQAIRIDLFEQPSTDTQFNIKVAGSDGEMDSAECDVGFKLYDLTAELQNLQQLACITVVPDTIIEKHNEFNVSVSFDFPAGMSQTVKDALLTEIQEHYTVQLQISDQREKAPLVWQDGTWRATCSVELAGDYTLRAVFNCDHSDLRIEATKIGVQIRGSVPEIGDEMLLPIMGLVLPKQDDSGNTTRVLDGLTPSQLFKDANQDDITASVTVAQYSWKNDEWQQTLDVTAVGDQLAEVQFDMPGKYEVRIKSSDVDGNGAEIASTIFVITYKQSLILGAVVCVLAILIAVLLIRTVAHIIKPSFKGKMIEVTISSSRWERVAQIRADAWKKKKQPLSALLTCAACPPDSMLYEAAKSCIVKPNRKGITLLKGSELGFEKKTRILLNETVEGTWNQYAIRIGVSSSADVVQHSQIDA